MSDVRVASNWLTSSLSFAEAPPIMKKNLSLLITISMQWNNMALALCYQLKNVINRFNDWTTNSLQYATTHLKRTRAHARAHTRRPIYSTVCGWPVLAFFLPHNVFVSFRLKENVSQTSVSSEDSHWTSCTAYFIFNYSVAPFLEKLDVAFSAWCEKRFLVAFYNTSKSLCSG